MPDQTALGALGGIFNTIANDTLSYANNIKNNETRVTLAGLDDQKAVDVAGIASSTVTWVVIAGAMLLVGFAIIKSF